MKPWIDVAMQIYPASWRNRYGIEFRALLDDVNPGWRELFDVIKGALKMRMTNAPSYLKFAAAFALFGLAASITASFFSPKQYSAAATIRITPTQLAETGATFNAAPFVQVEQEALSRSSLSHHIQTLDLYPSQRQRVPFLEVIDSMREHDVHVTLTATRSAAANFNISFTYPDRRKAQALVDALVAQIANNFAGHRDVNSHMRGAVPIYQTLEVLDAPHVLNTVRAPNRMLFASAGASIGLLLGLLIAAFVQHTRTAIVFACLGAGGCVIGAAISPAMPQRYVSQASVRIVYFDRIAGTAEGRDWMVKNMNEVLSRESLSEMIQRPKLNLYPTERAKLPLEEVLDSIRRRDISFHVREDGHGAPSTALDITFAYRDQRKAQSMLNAVIQRFISESRNSIRSTDRPGSELKSGIVEYIDNADYPVVSVGHNRTFSSIFGLALGLIGAALLYRLSSASNSQTDVRLRQ
jgi:LPS O-antigen subunit length determinant protein (WzzB/FepE family)